MASILIFIAAGVGAMVLGGKLGARPLWVQVLGYVLCAFFALYTLFILGITPNDAFLRPLLLWQISVLVLCAVTVVSLIGSEVAQTSNLPVNPDAREGPRSAEGNGARAGYRER